MPRYRAGPVVYRACVTGCLSLLPFGHQSGLRHSSRESFAWRRSVVSEYRARAMATAAGNAV